VDGHPHAQGEGGFPVPDRLAPEAAALIGGDPAVGIEPVEGLLALADGVPLEVGMGVGELVGEADVVVAVAGAKVAAEAVGDLVDGPVAELVPPQAAGVCRCASSSPRSSRVSRCWSWPVSGGLVGAGSRVGWLPIQELLLRVVGGRGLSLAAARAHPWNRSAGQLTGGGHGPHLPSWVRSPAAPRGGAGEA
jgi:hypothetical protein